MSTTALQEVAREDCLGLLRDAMQSVGPASQTLAAFRRLARRDGETFASVRRIAEVACLPTRTVERHIETLLIEEWLTWTPRQRRRTPTYHIPKSLLNRSNEKKFAMLPRWAAVMLKKRWADRAVFACIVSRHSLNERIGDGEAGENFGRLQYSIRTLAADTGLSREAIATAKRSLIAKGLLTCDPGTHSYDGRWTADTLYLNHDFEVPRSLVDHA